MEPGATKASKRGCYQELTMAMKSLGVAILEYVAVCVVGLVFGITLVFLFLSPIPTISVILFVWISLLTKKERVPMFLLGFVLWSGSWLWYDSQNLILALTCSGMYITGATLWWFASALPLFRTMENHYRKYREILSGA